MAKAGAGQKTIASALGITDKTFKIWLKEYPELDAAYKTGLGSEETMLVNSLHKRAKDPANSTGSGAAMFLLKTRHGYREKDDVEDATRLNIVYTIPQSLPLADYLAALALKKADGAKKITKD
jgi:hypothetical protein